MNGLGILRVICRTGRINSEITYLRVCHFCDKLKCIKMMVRYSSHSTLLEDGAKNPSKGTSMKFLVLA